MFPNCPKIGACIPKDKSKCGWQDPLASVRGETGTEVENKFEKIFSFSSLAWLKEGNNY